MKKIIVSIIVIGCLLASSIASVNALVIQTKNEKTMMSLNEQNPLRNILDKKDYFNAINIDDIQYSGNPLLTGFDGNIVHAYFNTWDGEQDNVYGTYRLIINDGYLYQPVQVYKDVPYDEWVAILKYNASDGSLCDFEVYYDQPTNCGKKVVVIIDNWLFVNGLNYDTGYSFIVKYNISGDSITFEESLTLPYHRAVLWNLCTDGYNIYICADNESDGSLLLQKYNTDLEPIWSEPKKWNGLLINNECNDMTFYDGSIFVTGETFGNDTNANSFVLKFDSNGNLLKEIIESNYLGGWAIKGYNGKIYVANEVFSVFGLFDFLVSAYDTDLVNLWTSERYNYGILHLDIVLDIVIVDDYIYMAGWVTGIDWRNWLAFYEKGFIIKLDISNGEKIWWKTVDAPGNKPWTDASGICADESYLYLSGMYYENWTTEEATNEAYILKCDFNGNPHPESPNVPSITGETKGEAGVIYYYKFLSTMNSYTVDLKYFIDWGDGSTDTTNFYLSGQEITVGHTWSEKGNYVIRAKAITIDGYESGWGTLSVKMPLDLQGSQQSSPTPQTQPSSQPISQQVKLKFSQLLQTMMKTIIT